MKKDFKSKLIWLTIFHRVVMLTAAYLYIDAVVSITSLYGNLWGAIFLNAINMIIYYIYHYVFLKLLKIEKTEKNNE